MPIVPLPQFEADVAELERERLVASLRGKGHDPEQLASLTADELETLDRKKKPGTLVVRYGRMRMIGEFPYSGDMTPGCGSKLVVRTHRGVEMGELLTSTCPNSGCGSSVSRQEMLEYIENSGGRQYPFSTDGRVLRVATKEDMDEQARLEQSAHELKVGARAISESLGLSMKVVEAEPILGGERLTFYYTSDDRVDFRELVRELGARHRARIDMRQVGARDEARLVADYEKCGQYCCCKNFLKVLRPISMKSAKVQKATLDPVKISGRCGRLMCCLRYEDETYEALSKRLPRRKSRVGTPDGDATVIQTQILTQLVLVRFDDGRDDQAYPVEEIGKAGERPASSGPARERPAAAAPGRERGPRRERAARPARTESGAPATDAAPAVDPETGEPLKKKRRRRRRKKKAGDGVEGATPQTGADPAAGETAGDAGTRDAGERAPGSGAEEQGGSERTGDGDATPTKKKRRRRRRRRRSGDGPAAGGEPGGERPGGPGEGGGDG